MIFISRLPSSMVALHKSESDCMGFLSKIKLPMGPTLHYVRYTLFQLVKQHLISINIFQFFFCFFFFTLISSFIYYHFLNDLIFLDFLKSFFFSIRDPIRDPVRSRFCRRWNCCPPNPPQIVRRESTQRIQTAFMVT